MKHHKQSHVTFARHLHDGTGTIEHAGSQGAAAFASPAHSQSSKKFEGTGALQQV